jgi:hypothetical protein
LALAFAVVGSGGLVATAASAGPRRIVVQDSPGLADATVLVIRHAEKPETGTDLTPTGVARAKAYSNYFHSYQIDGKPVHVDYVFATADSKGSHRERLTVEPLAQSMHLTPDLRFKNKACDELVSAIKAKSYGKTILICWHHGKIPDILTALGADPAKLLPGGKWPGEDFDWVVQLRFDHTGHLADAKTVHEHLLPGDK